MKNPQIHPTATVFPHAVVLGDVTLMEESSIWFGAVARAELDSLTVGRRSNVQDNCVIHVDASHPCRIGDDVTIGHGAILHGCTIGNNTMVGMGAIVLSGAKIGSNCLIGAGAVVTGKMDAPDGSLLLGNPAKIVKEVTPEMIEEIKKDAALYIQLARRGL